MVVYNLTTRVAPGIAAAWRRWQQEKFIPAVLNSGFFSAHKLFHLVGHDEEDGITYVTQFFSSSLDDCSNFIQQEEKRLLQHAAETWHDQVVSFSTVMEAVN